MCKDSIFTEEQLVLIRDTFGDLCQAHIEKGLFDYAEEELKVINAVQRQLDCEEYISLEQFRNNSSGTWTYISVEDTDGEDSENVGSQED
ncbi:hypothetical protein [Phocaeicola plebeius]|uniref:hypothetical protein n=1 Tax=Phocaeicola plebeius TaxID=310297 RepID=UPI003563489B